MIERVATYLEQVAEHTGLDDYGDPTFRDGLEVFVASLAEAGCNQIGAAVADAQIRGALRNRLRVQDWYRSHPDLAGERIVAPVFIVGMSRSGTTALSHLLARVPGNRSLLGWEAADPVPPPQPATWDTDPRYEAAKANEFGLLRPSGEFAWATSVHCSGSSSENLTKPPSARLVATASRSTASPCTRR